MQSQHKSKSYKSLFSFLVIYIQQRSELDREN